jgi:hypothetical protein
MHCNRAEDRIARIISEHAIPLKCETCEHRRGAGTQPASGIAGNVDVATLLIAIGQSLLGRGAANARSMAGTRRGK